MSGSTIQFESSNMQNILIALVVICAIVYAFLEFRKVNNKIKELENVMSKMHQEMERVSMNDTIKYSDSSINAKQENNKVIIENDIKNDIENDIEQSLLKKDILMDSIINEVEQELNQGPPTMSGLFISLETDKESRDDRIVEIDEEVSSKDNKSEIIVNTSQNIDNDIDNDIESVEDILINQVSSNYEEYTIRELKDKLTDMNLPTSGNKLKLIERIISNENKI